MISGRRCNDLDLFDNAICLNNYPGLLELLIAQGISSFMQPMRLSFVLPMGLIFMNSPWDCSLNVPNP